MTDPAPPRPTRRLRPDGLTRPRADRFPPTHPSYSAVLAAHDRAAAAGDAGYVDPLSGLFALCATHLAARGWCCENGCRHCPYEP